MKKTIILVIAHMLAISQYSYGMQHQPSMHSFVQPSSQLLPYQFIPAQQFLPYVHADHTAQHHKAQQMYRVQKSVDSLHANMHNGFASIDKEIKETQREFDLLQRVEHSHYNAQAHTNALLESMIEQHHLEQQKREDLQQVLHHLRQQIEQQQEQQKQLLSSLAILTQPKVTHEIATQTDDIVHEIHSKQVSSQQGSAAASSARTTPNNISASLYTDKKYFVWKRNQEVKKAHNK